MKYYIYCDESDKKGINYSDFFGGALVKQSHVLAIEKEIADFKAKHSYKGELKWNKIKIHHKKIYTEFVELIFQIIKKYDIKVRIFFRQNINLPSYDLTENHKKKTYFYLYNQFLKHHFGLQIINKEITRIQIYADDIPDKKGDSIEEFKRWVCKAFNDQGIVLKDEDISEVESSKHGILQIVDVLLGAIQFKLNDKDKFRIKPREIPTKTKLKTEVYQLINKEIRKLEPQDRYKNFNIGVNTARLNERDVLDLPWRHWNFKPK